MALQCAGQRALGCLPNSQQGALSLVSKLTVKKVHEKAAVFSFPRGTRLKGTLPHRGVVLSPQKSEKVHKFLLLLLRFPESESFSSRFVLCTTGLMHLFMDSIVFVMWNISLKIVIGTINHFITYSLTLPSFKTRHTSELQDSLDRFALFLRIFHDILHFHCVNRWRPVVFGRKCTMSWVEVQGAPVLLLAPVDTMKSKGRLCFQKN